VAGFIITYNHTDAGEPYQQVYHR